MSRIQDLPELQVWAKDIINAVPDHMKSLISGHIEFMLIHYNSAALKALGDLHRAIPSQNNDQDWWSDELREAMEQAAKLV